MNVAEDERNSFAVEVHGARSARLIKSQVKALAVEQRKHVVEPGIVIGKLDSRASRHYQQMGLEGLVLLRQYGVHGCNRRGIGYGRQPNDGRDGRRDVCALLQEPLCP
jgi:hypothetical protein